MIQRFCYDMNRKEIEKEHYNKQAREVDLLSMHMNPAIRTPYIFWEEWIKGRCQGKTLLDYGCGSGFHSIFPAKNGAFVIGVDISEEALNIARERAVRDGVEKFTSFRVGDCEKLEFKQDSFDFIFSSGTLSCLNLERAYSELVRVVKREGYVVIIDTLGYNPALNLSRKIKYRMGLRTKHTLEHVLKIEDIKKACAYFYEMELHFFDLVTLCIAPFIHKGDTPFAKISIRIARTIDKFLLSIPFLQKYAFKVVCILSKPKKMSPVH